MGGRKNIGNHVVVINIMPQILSFKLNLNLGCLSLLYPSSQKLRRSEEASVDIELTGVVRSICLLLSGVSSPFHYFAASDSGSFKDEQNKHKCKLLSSH